MRLRFIGILLAAAILPAQELPDWVLTLSKIKRQAREELQRIPNYVCLETVERFEAYAREGFHRRDTLRLQVAVVDRQELIAPADAGHLETGNPNRYSRGGALGTGAFSAFASNLFVHDNGRTTGWAREELGGPPAWRYDYEISERVSGFKLSTLTGDAVVAERGSFWANASTLDLLRIEAEAVDIPVRLGLQDVFTSIDYHRVRMGATDLLMPKSAEMVTVSVNGERHKNVTAFSACREYRSESVIRFDTDK